MAVDRIWNGSAWEDIGAAVPGVTLNTTQTITGQKTFSLAPLVPDGSFTVGKISATGTRDSTTFLRGDGTWATVSTGPPSNMVTTDSTQTISAVKTFSAAPVVPNASWTIANTNGLQTALDAKYSASNPPPATDLSNYVTLNGTQSITGAKTFTVSPAVPDSSFTIAKINATGTRDGTTFLRGDGTWAVPPGGGGAPANMVTTDTTQTITAVKTLSNNGNVFNGNTLTLVSALATDIPLVISGLSTQSSPLARMTAGATQTGDFLQLRDSGNNTVARISKDGYFFEGTTRLFTNVEPYVMAITGNLTVQAGKSRIYVENTSVIESIRASVNTASAGASIIVDVNLNGTTIYGTQANRPTITAGANTALGGAPTSTTVSAGQYITIDVDQVGSTTAGADLTVAIRLRRTA